MPTRGLPEPASRTVPSIGCVGAALYSNVAPKNFCWPGLKRGLTVGANGRTNGSVERVSTPTVSLTIVGSSKQRNTSRSRPTPVMRNRPSESVTTFAGSPVAVWGR